MAPENGQKSSDSFTFRIKKNTVERAAAFTTIVALGLGSHFGLAPLLDSHDDDEAGASPPAPTVLLDNLSTKYFIENPEAKIEQLNDWLADKYIGIRTGLIDLYEPRLQAGASEETKEIIRKERLSSVMTGAHLLKRMDWEHEISIDEKKKTVTIDQATLDLSDTYQLFLADGILSRGIWAQYDTSENNIQGYKKSVADLIWLSKQDFPVTFEEFSFVFPHPDFLIYLSRTEQNVVALGDIDVHPVRFKRWQKGDPAGWYNSKEIVITNRGYPDTIPHEFGHNYADKSKNYSQAKYNQMVIELKKKTPLSDEEEKESYIDRSVTMRGNEKRDEQSTLGEDYAETYEHYLFNGEHFRTQIVNLNLNNKSGAARILQAKYDFMKELERERQFVGKMDSFPGFSDVYYVRIPLTPYGDLLKSLPLYSKPEIGSAASTEAYVQDGQTVMIQDIIEGLDYSGKKVLYASVVKGVFDEQNNSFTYYSGEPPLFGGGWLIAESFLRDKLNKGTLSKTITVGPPTSSSNILKP